MECPVCGNTNLKEYEFDHGFDPTGYVWKDFEYDCFSCHSMFKVTKKYILPKPVDITINSIFTDHF